MTTNDLRVGLIGANASYGWGKAAHVPAIVAAPGVTLHAVASRSRDGAEAAARAFGAKFAFDDADDLLASPDVDLVAVAVRAPAHRDLVLAAIDAGKPVYCEWPLGLDLGQAREMAAAAALAGVLTSIGLQGRHSPWLIHLRDTIADGAIGRVLSARMVADDDLPYAAFAQSNVYMLKRDGGANALAVHAGHFLDCVAFVLGEFAAVSGMAATTRRTVTIKETGEQVRLEAPDQVVASMITVDGAVVGAQIVGGSSPGPSMTLLVYGTKGVLRATSAGYMHWRPVEIAIARTGSDVFEPVAMPAALFTLPRGIGDGPEHNLAYAYAAFAKAIRSGTRFRPDFVDAAIRHETVDAITVVPPAGGGES